MEKCIFGHDIPDTMYRANIDVKGETKCICMEHDVQVFHGVLSIPR